MRLVSKHLGNSKERVPAQWHVMLLSGLSHASVQIAFHIWQRMKNSACAKIPCVSFLILPSLFLLLLFPKWIGFVLGAILCVSMIKTCATLNYSETLATVSSLSYWILHCSPLTMIGWPPVFWGILLTLGGTSFLLGVPSFYLRKEPRESLHRQCMWSMLCCYENKHQNMYVMIFYYVFAFGIEFSNFHQNLVRALHCHDNWGFTSLSTLMIYRLLVVFLYLFLNILCGYLVVYVSLGFD